MTGSGELGGEAGDGWEPRDAEPLSDASDHPRTLPTGTRLPPSIPDLELIRRIGRGAYGEVWLTRSLTGVYRATKIVFCGTDERQRAFDREYRGIQNYEPISLTHPSLMDVVRVGRNDPEGFFYYEMELADDVNRAPSPLGLNSHEDLDGVEAPLNPATYEPFTLRRLFQRGRLSVEASARLGIELLAALGELHRRGRIHRDVKPSNIIFVNGQPKLTDVGLVALVDASRSVAGTPGYAPAEGPGTASADLFSLGKVLYEASTGKDRTAFPEAPTVLDPREDEEWAELNEVILQACASEPSRRYESAAKMANDLHLVLAGRSVRRLRRMAGVTRRLKRVSVAAAVAMAVTAAIAFYQRHQADRFKALEAEHRRQVIQLNVANGIRAFEDDDLQTSLLWLTEALRIETEGGGDEQVHRMRLGMTWQQIPQLIGLGVHEGPINMATFSPDGSRILTASDDGDACLWELQGDEPVHRWNHSSPVKWAAFDADGRRVVGVTADGAARIWDTVSGELLLGPLLHDAMLYHGLFSLDGARIVTAGESGISIWDAANGKLLLGPFGHAERVNEIALSPNGRWIVSSSFDHTARVWDILTGEPVTPPLRHRANVQQAAFSPDGASVVTASWDGTVQLWDAASGEELHPPWRLDEPAWFACFSHDGKKVLAGGGIFKATGVARVWHVAGGEPVTPFLRFDGPVRRGCFSPDDLWFSAGDSAGKAHVFDAIYGVRLLPQLREELSIWHCIFDPSGHRLLTAGKDGHWRLWELASRTWAAPSLYQQVKPLETAFSPDGSKVAISGTDGAWIWEPDGGRGTWVAQGLLEGKSARVAFSRDQRFLAIGGGFGNLVLHDLDGGEERTLDGHAAGIHAMAFSPSGACLATASEDRTLKLWSMENARLTHPPFEHPHTVWSVAFSPDGTIVATGSGRETAPSEGELRLYSVRTGQLVADIVRLPGRAVQVAYSPDGRWLAAACAELAFRRLPLLVLDTTTAQPPPFRLALEDGICQLAFSPDSKRIAASDEGGMMRIWSLVDGAPLTPVFRHRRGARVLSFDSRGAVLLSGSLDGTARLWSGLTGELLGPPIRHPLGVEHACWGPQGRRIAVADKNHRVKLCSIDTERRALPDLRDLAFLYAGARPHPPSDLQWAGGQELRDVWRDLRASLPHEFEADAGSLAQWERNRASAIEVLSEPAQMTGYRDRIPWE